MSTGSPRRKPTVAGATDNMGIYWLKPGESSKEDAVLSELFTFSSPGEYVVQLSRYVDDDLQKQLVKSNKLTITVTE